MQLLNKISRLSLTLTTTLTLLVVQNVTGQANRDTPFYVDNINYDPNIPRPETVIGHPLGHRIARNDLLVQYLRTIAELTPRITVETMAYTHEGRPILALTITSPENHARIDAIKASHVALSDPNSGQEVDNDMPIITWLNYGVHGAEVSSTDSSMAVAYHLAAAPVSYTHLTLPTKA